MARSMTSSPCLPWMMPLAAPSRPPRIAPATALLRARFWLIHSFTFFAFCFGAAGCGVVAHAVKRVARTRIDAMLRFMLKLLRRQFLGGDEDFRIVLLVGPTVVSLKAFFQPS